jgi:DNA polymerase III delta prime subunit
MAPTANAVNNLLATLEEEDLKAAISFIQFLSATRKEERSKNSKSVLHEIQGMFEEDKGWDSEESMIEDLAAFRKERMNV